MNTKKKALISLGVPKREAWMLANSRKAYARCASSFLNNEKGGGIQKKKKKG